MSLLVSPGTLLRLEGAAVLVAAATGYQWLAASWGLFFVLFLAPDLSILGYLAGPRAGAACYNLAHTYAAPFLLAATAWAVGWFAAWPLCLVWSAHIGFDRLLGFGLKYPTAFRDTHFGAIGRR
jgi:hypothetical protein